MEAFKGIALTQHPCGKGLPYLLWVPCSNWNNYLLLDKKSLLLLCISTNNKTRKLSHMDPVPLNTLQCLPSLGHTQACQKSPAYCFGKIELILIWTLGPIAVVFTKHYSSFLPLLVFGFVSVGKPLTTTTFLSTIAVTMRQFLKSLICRLVQKRSRILPVNGNFLIKYCYYCSSLKKIIRNETLVMLRSDIVYICFQI